MIFMRNFRIIFLYFTFLYSGSETRLKTHYFITGKQIPNYIKFYHKKNLDIKSYEIYEADIGSSFRYFMPISYNNDIPKKRNILFIDVGLIDKRIDKEYMIWINHGEGQILYSNTLIYDAEEGYFKFTNRHVYKLKSF